MQKRLHIHDLEKSSLRLSKIAILTDPNALMRIPSADAHVISLSQ